MSPGFLLCVALAVTDPTPREPHPLAPSLPRLTDEEDDRIDDIINRFIKADIGQLRGEEARKAVVEFNKLGPEATFNLIRGLNRAAQIEASCPVVVISKKLMSILNSSDDLELLEFARENIGADAGQTRHLALLKDMRVGVMLRKRTVALKGPPARPVPVGPVAPRSTSTSELTAALSREKGDRFKQVVAELELRKGAEVVTALGVAAGITYDKDAQVLARAALGRNLARQGAAVIKERLNDDNGEVRAAAARAAGALNLRLGAELIALLEDPETKARTAAQQTLVKLNRGTDLGPAADATDADRAAAVRRWQQWWAKQAGR